MTNRESKLLIFLIFFSIAVLFFLTFQNSFSEIKESKQTIEKYTEMTQKLQVKKQPENNNSKTTSNAAVNQIQSTSEITDLIIKDLRRAGIVPLRYQISKDSKGEFIEVSLSCSNTRLVNYFKQMKADIYPYTVSVLNIKTDADKVNASIRYSVNPSKIVSSASEKSYPIERLFRPVYKNTVVQNSVVETPAKTEDNIHYNNDYTFIGRVKGNDGIEYMYLKNPNTNRILKIAPKDIISEDNEKYLISTGTEKFYIRKVN